MKAPPPLSPPTSVGSKAAGFAILLRVFVSAIGPPFWTGLDWGLIFAILAAIGMTVGNIIALTQTNIKRMLGYSSIAQAGYLLVGLATVGFVSPVLSDSSVFAGQSGLLFFLASYALTNLGAFTAIIAISGKVDSDLIKDYAGMGKRAPLLALALSLCLISLIGMPPAAGFMAKFYIFSGAAQHGLLWLVIIAVINSVISAYYYLRVVKVMWFGQPASQSQVPSSISLRVALGLSCFGVLFMGIVPGFVMKLAEMAAQIFVS
jgi:NADH-quinone oxidoreductase subunit N